MSKLRQNMVMGLVLCLVCPLKLSASDAPGLSKLDATVQPLVAAGTIVGAQLLLGDGDAVILEKNYGVRSVSDSTAVDADTLFCIGSCSKPFASALLMTLVQDETLSLDEAVDLWLPEFGSLNTHSGDSVRAPTLRELLSHRGGIYSQKTGMTKRQSRWIRDFQLTLKEAVNGIAVEPLIASPGETYAYSGAGYCVIGRVSELASGRSVEALLQERICKPLGLLRTTYFPAADNPNIATGSVNGKPNGTTPHLSKPFRLPLIGGSIYSTAKESSWFLRMLANRGTFGDIRILSENSFNDLSGRQVDDQTYGLGWNLQIQDGETVGMTHSGSLASSRALFMVNLKTGMYGVILYTLSDPGFSQSVSREISQAMKRVVHGSSDRP